MRALLGTDGEVLPGWIRQAVELGVPSETAAQLVVRTGVSRDGAVRVARLVGPQWSAARSQLDDLVGVDPHEIGLTQADGDRLRQGAYDLPF